MASRAPGRYHIGMLRAIVFGVLLTAGCQTGDGSTSRTDPLGTPDATPPVSGSAGSPALITDAGNDAPDCDTRGNDTCLESSFCTMECPRGGSSANCVPVCTLKPCSTFAASVCPEGVCRVTDSCDGLKCVTVLNEGDLECGPHSYYAGTVECCEGLELRCGTLLNDNSCDNNAGFPVCLACGDGTCEAPETECNCPEDCGE